MKSAPQRNETRRRGKQLKYARSNWAIPVRLNMACGSLYYTAGETRRGRSLDMSRMRLVSCKCVGPAPDRSHDEKNWKASPKKRFEELQQALQNLERSRIGVLHHREAARSDQDFTREIRLHGSCKDMAYG